MSFTVPRPAGDKRLSTPGLYWWRMLCVVASRPGGLARALLWLAMYASARIVLVRRISRRLAGKAQERTALRSRSIFEADVAAIAESVRLKGFDSSLRLPPLVVGELASFGDAVEASTPYSHAEHQSSSTIEEIARDPTLQGLAGTYLGGSPIYQGSRIWWTRPGQLTNPTETGARFHYDLYDYRALIFLFYLTDVAADGGPHVCVQGSHRARTWRDQVHPRRHRSDEEVTRAYGKDWIVTICGPAGSVIVEDPFCFHKVKLPVQRARLALQLLFTGSDFPIPSFHRAESTRGGG